MPIKMLKGLSPTPLMLFVILGSLSAYSLYSIGLRWPFNEGDSGAIISGVHAFNTCWEEGFTKLPCGIQTFPLLQYLLVEYDILFSSEPNPFRFLVVISFLSVVGMFGVMYFVFRHNLVMFGLSSIILISSPFLLYSRSTFGESVAAFLTLAFGAACVKRAPSWIIVPLFVLSGITKEVAFPFLSLVALACWFDWKGKIPWNKVSALIIANTLTIAINAGFNYIRYGDVMNLGYLQPKLQVTTLQSLINMFAIWFSPLVGLLFIWLSFGLLFAFGVWQLCRNIVSKDGFDNNMFILSSALAIMAAISWGLANWWSVFGWFAYTQRLSLPWIPLVAMLIMVSQQHNILNAISYLKQKKWLGWLVTCAVVISALPNIMYSITPNRPWSWIHSVDYFGLSYEPKFAVDYKVQNAMAFSGKTMWHSAIADWYYRNQYYFIGIVLLLATSFSLVVKSPISHTPIIESLKFQRLNKTFYKVRIPIFIGAGLVVLVTALSFYQDHAYYFKGEGIKTSFHRDDTLTSHHDTIIMPSLEYKWPQSPLPSHKDLFSLIMTGEYFHEGNTDTIDLLAMGSGEVKVEIGNQTLLFGPKKKTTKVNIKPGWNPIRVEFRSTGGQDQELMVRLDDLTRPTSSEKLSPADPGFSHIWPSPKDIAQKYYELKFIKL